MKITDLTLTLFAWENIPATTYGRHTGKFGGKSQLGLLTLRTDEGAEGHAFLGSASRGAQYDAELFRAFTEVIVCLATTQQVLVRPAVRDKVERWKHEPAPAAPGPDRQQLLSLLSAPA